ncbi:MAG: prenyltransferase/squalene oxidase repeat-containing protein [Phycisphaerales bacterium]
MRTALLLIALTTPSPALAIDQAHRERAHDMIARACAELVAQQHPSGGWNITDDPNAPVLPAITGLAINALALHPADDDHETSASRADAIARGTRFLLDHAQPDGGIYDAMLPSYNTAICVSALVHARDLPGDLPGATDAQIDDAIASALAFMRTLQWGQDARQPNPDGTPSAGDTVRVVAPDHPFYGGVGYGRHGRPDNSNLNFITQAFHDAGVDRDDPVFQRALVFLQRTQMHEAVNDAPYAEGSTQGGFIYATAESGDEPGVGQSQAGTIEETLDDGTRVSRLRAYGSMTYAAFKTMIYAGLSPEDERVRLALGWIERNYTLDENPGMGTEGQYYYYLMFARALEAAGVDTIEVEPIATESENTTTRDWANDLIDALADLQNPDGSFRPVDERWMENNPVLITAYAAIALEHAAGLVD